MSPLNTISFLGLDENFVEHESTIINTGDNFNQTYIKLRNPRKVLRIHSGDPSMTFIEFDMSLIQDRLNIGGLAIINHNLRTINIGAAPLYTKTPAGLYRIKYSKNKIYHRLFPESIIESSNLNGIVSNVQEYPENKITNLWLTAVDNLTPTSVRFSFINGIPQLLSSPEDQIFEVLVRKTNSSGLNPSVKLTLYNNGVATTATTTQVVTSTVGQKISLFWEFGPFNVPANNVELKVESLNTTDGTVEYGAALWMPQHQVDLDTGLLSVNIPSSSNNIHLYIHHFIEEPIDGIKYVLFESIDRLLEYHEFGSAVIGRNIRPIDSEGNPIQVDWGGAGITVEMPNQQIVQTLGGSEFIKGTNRLKRRKINQIKIKDVPETQAISDFWGHLLVKRNINGVFYCCLNPSKPQHNEYSIYGRLESNFDLVPMSASLGAIDYDPSFGIIEVIG